MQYCPENGKFCFTTRRKAERAAQSMRERYRGVPSVYYCDTCQHYHLTHYDYSHCKAISELRKTGYYSNPLRPTKQKKKPKPMQIFLETDTEGAMLKVDIPNPADSTQLRLGLVKVSGTQDIMLTYTQAQELIEALRIQLAKIKLNSQ